MISILIKKFVDWYYKDELIPHDGPIKKILGYFGYDEYADSND